MLLSDFGALNKCKRKIFNFLCALEIIFKRIKCKSVVNMELIKEKGFKVYITKINREVTVKWVSMCLFIKGKI